MSWLIDRYAIPTDTVQVIRLCDYSSESLKRSSNSQDPLLESRHEVHLSVVVKRETEVDNSQHTRPSKEQEVAISK